MNILFPPFSKFISKYTVPRVRSKYTDSTITTLDLQPGYIQARVRGTSLYSVEIKYNNKEVLFASCNCPYDYGGYCKHVVNVLVHADHRLSADNVRQMLPLIEPDHGLSISRVGGKLILSQVEMLSLTREKLVKISVPKNNIYHSERVAFASANFAPNSLSGYLDNYESHGPRHIGFQIHQQDKDLIVTCDCNNQRNLVCEHLFFVMDEIIQHRILKLPFDAKARHEELGKVAKDKGWENLTNYDEFFAIRLENRKIFVDQKINLLAYSEFEKANLRTALLPEVKFPKEKISSKIEFIVIEESGRYNRFNLSLMHASLSKNGQIKSPVNPIDSIQEKLRHAQSREETLFYSAFLPETNQNEQSLSLDAYKDMLNNPLELPLFLVYPPTYSGKINPKSLQPISRQQSPLTVEIVIDEKEDFYRLWCRLILDDQTVELESLMMYEYLFVHQDILYCLNNENESKVIHFFTKKNFEVFIQKSHLESFRTDFLDPLENVVKISYSFTKPAPKNIIIDQGLHQIGRRLVYLSELNNFILITPTVSYGDIEIPVLSKRTLYIKSPDGSMYAAERDQTMEGQFLRTIQAHHKSFESSPQTEFYYLPRKEFLDQGWFLHALEVWRNEGYIILGFDKLKSNRYNQHRMKVRSEVKSGIDWFDIQTEVSFGQQTVSLKQLQKSIFNKARFIELNDGTHGLIPEEWLKRFDRYFRAGEITDGSIRTHKSNFQLIDELFENEVLNNDIQLELHQYKKKLNDFHSIAKVKVPKKLKAKLRDYQKEGLNWLNFLDEFNFGGCLADDMGLGKTLQIIAYMLTQHEKGNTGTNLVVVPTSLLFNWQREIEKFAPHLQYYTLYGSDRNTSDVDMEHHHLILTTYGTLLTDIKILKDKKFNLIILDESQAIKNPESKRYKSVRLLQGRQRIVVTGTPVENNTFDLFSQLSFAMPGLLGTAKRFSSDYSTPIDKFQDAERAGELQRKIHPFVLRRTKKQVATELPPKTEIVHFCEMEAQQQDVYNSYKAEFQKYLSDLSEEEVQSSSLHILQGITKLRQICNSPSLLGDEEFYGEESAKIRELMHQLRTLKDAHKILVFSQFVGMLDLVKEQLEKENIGYAYLTGKTKNREREVERFQQDEAIRVFLISLKAGGTGLNLTQAEYVFLIDPWWNPAVENQAIDRAYRIGQQNKVIAIRFITPNSIEEKIMELQERKRLLAEELIHTDSSILKSLQKKDLLNLL